MNDDAVVSTAQQDRDPVRGSARRALHVQVSEQLKALAAELGIGAKLPSEAELVDRFAVSRTTVRRALKDLTEAGILDVQHGRGSFVAAPPVTQSVDEFRPFVESLITEGERSIEVLDAGWRVGWEVPAAIGGPDLPGFGFRWLHRIDGRPHALFDCTLPVDIGRSVNSEMVAATPIYYLLEQELGIVPHSADFTFSAGPADLEVASHLAVDPGSSLLILERTTTSSDGAVIECGRYLIVPELHRVRLTANARRLASVLDFARPARPH